MQDCRFGGRRPQFRHACATMDEVIKEEIDKERKECRDEEEDD
jgi:hypothetical protein